MKKHLFSIALFLLVVTVSARFYFRLTDDFRISNITHELTYRPEWATTAPDQLMSILQQRFYYLGKGSQSYAFASEDGQFVLKFFKYKHLRPHWLVESLSALPYFSDYQKKQSKRKARKFEHLFAGYHLAWNHLREESGLIFIHLNETKGLFPKVTLIDKIGLKRSVDLDSVVFIVQKKVEMTRSVIDALLAKGDLATAQKRIRQILALYASEYQRGLYDMDHGVMHNTGFAGDQPIHLDIGKLTLEPRTRDPAFYRADIQKVAARISSWLKANHPESSEAMLADLKRALKEMFDV